MGWYPSTSLGAIVFLSTLFAFVVSTLVVFPAYSKALRKVRRRIASYSLDVEKWRNPWDVKDSSLWALHAIGFIGLGVYLVQILSVLGGFGGLVSAIARESYLIRGAEVEPIGIYISYFGWIAIPLTLLRWQIRRHLDIPLFIVLLIQIGGNLLFVDRTRPIWLGFISVLMILPFVRTLNFWRISLTVLAFACFGLTTFYLIAIWVGKTAEGLSTYGYVGIGLQAAAFYNYVTGGFAYFESVLEINANVDFVPQRILYPLFKLVAILGLTSNPPSQVLPFLEVPFPVNVGTFLEPYYSDGGILYLILGVIVSTLGVDLLALFFLRAINPLALFVWANLCFTSFIGFFVPKLVATPVWLFIFVAMVSITFSSFRKTAGSAIRTVSDERPYAN